MDCVHRIDVHFEISIDCVQRSDVPYEIAMDCVQRIVLPFAIGSDCVQRIDVPFDHQVFVILIAPSNFSSILLAYEKWPNVKNC